ncbi:clotting factor C-like isoform X2 [Chironomus tepperi]|uniref:clotting factor C-like isoform X2 n=1 Tax=Chironomus tepperi TaxID=113505 RepID=UPI00391F29A5
MVESIVGIKQPIDDEPVTPGYQLGSLFIKPAIEYIFQKQNNIETTTPYPYANYAYSPGYYKDSLVTCSRDALIGETILLTCMRENQKIPCNDTLFAKDIVKINCKNGYEYPSHTMVTTEIECKGNGKWSGMIYECQPVCGKLTKKSKALIIHGEKTDVTEFPWNAAIYTNNILICGGNIISERVMLSAAHCFTREMPSGVEQVSPDSFTVVVGKYFRDIKAVEKFPTQELTIQKIKIHDAYFGYSGNYDADIAIVTLNEKIIYQPHIGPVCLNFDLKTIADKQVPVSGTMGLVAGYGYTETDGNPSDRLKKISLPIVDIRTCKSEAPENYKPFVTSDKFCAGYTDGRGAVCKGDSGAGYVVPKIVGGENIYHIHGIVSNSRSIDGGCDLYFYTMFTHIQNYIDMIKEEVRMTKT